MPDSPELDEFESLVVDAIDRLPAEFQEVLAKVAVVVSDLGTQEHAYGQTTGTGWHANAMRIGSSSTVTRWSVTSAMIVTCLPARSSRLCVTSLLTTSAGMSEEREA